MNEATQQRAFDYFFATEAGGESAGIGLSTVRSIIANVDGWIEIESELEVGTRVHVYLGRHDRANEDTLAPEAPDHASSLGDRGYRP